MSARIDDPYAVLRVAAQYVARFRGALFVLKFSGALSEDPARISALAEEIRLITDFGIRLVLVHGAGSAIDSECARRGIPIRKIGGRRITTPSVLEVVCDRYQAINRSWVTTLAAAGLTVVGVSGQEDSLLVAEPRPPGPLVPGEAAVSWGAVGDLLEVDTGRFRNWINEGVLPVVASLTAGPRGETLNSNADTIASGLAVALQASKLVFLLGVPGLLRKRDDRTTVIPYADLADLAGFEASGMIENGMIVKTRAIESALSGGVESVHLVSGTDPDALVREVFTHEGSGTMIVARKRGAGP